MKFIIIILSSLSLSIPLLLLSSSYTVHSGEAKHIATGHARHIYNCLKLSQIIVNFHDLSPCLAFPLAVHTLQLYISYLYIYLQLYISSLINYHHHYILLLITIIITINHYFLPLFVCLFVCLSIRFVSLLSAYVAVTIHISCKVYISPIFINVCGRVGHMDQRPFH